MEEEVRVEEIREELEKFSSPLEKILFLELKARNLKGEALERVQLMIEEVSSSMEGARPINGIEPLPEFRSEDFIGTLPEADETEAEGEPGASELEELREEEGGGEIPYRERREISELTSYVRSRSEEVFTPYSTSLMEEEEVKLPAGETRIDERSRKFFEEPKLETELPEFLSFPELDIGRGTEDRETHGFGLEKEVKGYIRKLGEI